MIRTVIFSMGFAFFILSCTKVEEADLVVHHAKIYTVDSAFSEHESMAIKNGKIIGIGSNQYIHEHFKAKNSLDAESKFIVPGFIDAHCHFYGYGKGLNELNLVETKSFSEVLEKLAEYAKDFKGEWIVGRGWDQNDWANKNFPDRRKLDSMFPDKPVFLKRVDGHAALVNRAALKRAGVHAGTKVNGGEIQEYEVNGFPLDPDELLNGILVDNAVELVETKIPALSSQQIKEALLAAQKNCLAQGLTTVDDAGLGKRVVDAIDHLQKSGELKMRIYAMLTPDKENLEHYLKAGIYKTDRLNVRSFKFYGDGALGSRGAFLSEPYSDKAGWKGFMLNDINYYKENAQLMAEHGFQMNTHCIGDQAVKIMVEIYNEIIGKRENVANASKILSASAKENAGENKFNAGYADLRWRIEHAQVVDKKDQKKFSKNIIPSVQPTHATSDMYWAQDRLGSERIKNAYAYKDLLNAAGILALGTDFPVEDISPFKTFYAAVFRKDVKGFPEKGFQMENALNREETLKGMTIWAAWSNFEDKEKGSLQPGKWADFIVLDTDLMKCAPEKILGTQVLQTFIGGESVYKK